MSYYCLTCILEDGLESGELDMSKVSTFTFQEGKDHMDANETHLMVEGWLPQ